MGRTLCLRLGAGRRGRDVPPGSAETRRTRRQLPHRRSESERFPRPARETQLRAPGRRGRSLVRSDGSGRQSRSCSAFGLGLKFRGDLTARGAAAWSNTAGPWGRLLRSTPRGGGLGPRRPAAWSVRHEEKVRAAGGSSGRGRERPPSRVRGPRGGPGRGWYVSPRRVKPGRGRQSWGAPSWLRGRAPGRGGGETCGAPAPAATGPRGPDAPEVSASPARPPASQLLPLGTCGLF